MKLIATTIVVLLAITAALGIWNHTDQRALDATWQNLVSNANPDPISFDTSMVKSLPNAAQRFFKEP